MRLTILLLPGLLFGPVLAGCDRQKAEAPQGEAAAVETAATADPASYPTGRLDRSKAGTPAPEAVFENPDGGPARLADFRGKPVLVNLWATWCAPCVVEMPSLDALARRESESLAVLALSQDFGGRDKVSDFFRTHGFEKLEPYLDGEMQFMTALGVDTLPTTILYDSQGLEVWRMTGLADWSDERTERLLREAQAS